MRGTIATTLANVRNAYWELVFAIQALDVARGSLDLASKLVADNRARVEVGALAPLDVVQAQAEEATRLQAVAQADAQQRTSVLALKRLIVSGTDDPLWTADINPVDRPTFLADALDVQGAVRKALDNRTDLQIARKTIDSNDVTLRYMRNLTLDEATARALERNLDIAVERLNPQTFDLNIARIRAAYRPTATSTIGQLSRVQPPTSTLNGGTVVDNSITTYNSGLQQLVPWGGGAFAFQ
ncbi:MAG: hypothetical protein DMF88_14380, partial [Acidobacteria bacterium]